jgi:hypothetical protein
MAVLIDTKSPDFPCLQRVASRVLNRVSVSVAEQGSG